MLHASSVIDGIIEGVISVTLCVWKVVKKMPVFVIGITSKRDELDPALRRPGRLDREIECGVPITAERAEVSALPRDCQLTVVVLLTSFFLRCYMIFG